MTTRLLGAVEAGDTSVAVAVAACHRQEAVEGARWLIDQLKLSVREQAGDNQRRIFLPADLLEQEPVHRSNHLGQRRILRQVRVQHAL